MKKYIIILLLSTMFGCSDKPIKDNIYWYRVTKGDIDGYVKEDDFLYKTIVPIYNLTKKRVIGSVKTNEVPDMMR